MLSNTSACSSSSAAPIIRDRISKIPCDCYVSLYNITSFVGSQRYLAARKLLELACTQCPNLLHREREYVLFSIIYLANLLEDFDISSHSVKCSVVL